MQELDRFEDELIAQYRHHPVLANIALLSDEDFAGVLLQRRFLSLAFTPAYDLAIDLLRDEEGLRIARVILREEYPDSHGMRSHREDMTADMYRLGVSREALVHTRPTPATKRAIDATFDMIADAGTREDADLRVLAILRFWGEILVSVEYGRLWERMEPLLTQDGQNISSFYYPHHFHDAKSQKLATADLLGTSHADRLATRVSAFLGNGGEGAADSFREMEQRSLQIKAAFYDQFLPALERVGI
ncbi:hypothetical protein ACIPUC_25960 [Streptomyces sp. LARHCF249]